MSWLVFGNANGVHTEILAMGNYSAGLFFGTQLYKAARMCNVAEMVVIQAPAFYMLAFHCFNVHVYYNANVVCKVVNYFSF